MNVIFNYVLIVGLYVMLAGIAGCAPSRDASLVDQDIQRVGQSLKEDAKTCAEAFPEIAECHEYIDPQSLNSEWAYELLLGKGAKAGKETDAESDACIKGAGKHINLTDRDGNDFKLSNLKCFCCLDDGDGPDELPVYKLTD